MANKVYPYAQGCEAVPCPFQPSQRLNNGVLALIPLGKHFLVGNRYNLARLFQIHNMETSTDTVTVVIDGLVKKLLVAPLDLTTTYEERIELPKDAQLRNLWMKLDCTL
jgi:hypothetical protein